MSISLSLTPDPGGCYLLETKLNQPIPVGDGSIITQIASEIPPDRLFPVGTGGGAGMLVPARYENGELVSVYNPGESMNLSTAIDAFSQQLNGTMPSQPYLFSPNTRRLLIQDNALIGWQTILLTAPSLADGLSPFSVGMGDDGSNPQFSEYSGSMNGFWSYFPETIGNFFQSDYSWWTKAGVVAASAIAGLALAKFAVAASGVAVLGKVLGAIAGGVIGAGAFAAGAGGGLVVASSIAEFSSSGSAGWKAFTTGQSPPAGVAAKLGYSAAAMAASAEKLNRLAVDAGRGIMQAKQEFATAVQGYYNDLSNRINSFGSVWSRILPWLLGGVAAGGAYLAYKTWSGKR